MRVVGNLFERTQAKCGQASLVNKVYDVSRHLVAGLRKKFQIPKSQIPKKFQIPKSQISKQGIVVRVSGGGRSWRIGFVILSFEISGFFWDLGFWDLGFARSVFVIRKFVF